MNGKQRFQKKLYVNPEDIIIITNLRKGSVNLDIFLRENEKFWRISISLKFFIKRESKIKINKLS